MNGYGDRWIDEHEPTEEEWAEMMDDQIYYEDCPDCEGEGEHQYSEWDEDGEEWIAYTPCATCNGRGIVPPSLIYADERDDPDREYTNWFNG